MRKLVADADVVIENFKLGGLDKYGLDYESLKAINPRLIYCSITGFGHTGPYAERAGYDFMIQGMGGIMDLTGDPDGQPQKIGVAFADIFTGLYSVIAIQSALIMRGRTGKGQHIDMALFDCMSAVLANQAMNYLASGVAPKRMGNAHPNIAPYQTLPVSDGYFIIACGNDGQFAKLTALLESAKSRAIPAFSLMHCALPIAMHSRLCWKIVRSSGYGMIFWQRLPRQACLPGRSTRLKMCLPIRNSSRDR